MRLLLLAALLCIATTAHAQLNGVYTCANGNPGNAFNYGDIGAFFDALETQGVSGPVTLNVFDDGGPFASKPNYLLGNGPVIPFGIPGVSAANPVVIQAAPGERPEITGAEAAFGGSKKSAIVLFYASYTTISGVEFRGASGAGILLKGGSACTNVRIAGCRFCNILGNAISIMTDAVPTFSAPANVTIENNWIWNCFTHPLAAVHNAAVVSTSFITGQNLLVRHNTLVHEGGTWPWLFDDFSTGATGVREFVGNVTVLRNVSAVFGGGFVRAIQQFQIADSNVYFSSPGPSGFSIGNSTLINLTFAQWQALGPDVNGVEADPVLRSLAAGQEDLRLSHSSPAINRVQQATVNTDIFGTNRPFGAARDAGAHEFLPASMSIEYGASVVPFAGSINVGDIGPAGSIRTFTIRNGGPGHLEFTFSPRVIFFPGTNCHYGSHMVVQPPPRIQPAGVDVFSMFIKPFTLGPIDLLVSIDNTDPLRTPYTFTINATGVPGNQAAVVTAPPGSAITGPPGGPFACDLVMGVPPANVSLLVTDPEGDPIILQFSGPIGPMIFGLTGPQLGPASPLPLVFTGMPAAAPGVYLWFINYSDAGSQSVLPCQISFNVVNLPPTHVLAGATAGAGTLNAPYECAYDRGKGPADTIGLCLVDDPNAGQTVLLAWSAAIPGNPGAVGFNFSLAGPILTVAPSAMLTVAETGQHLYEIQLTDGLAVTTLYVAVVVGGPALGFANASLLPDGYVDRAYTLALALNGVVAPATFTVTAGALPDGLTLDAGTGEITGTPTQTGLSAFTVHAADITGATASRAFTLEITTPPPPKRQAAGSSGCVAGAGAGFVPLLLLAAVRRRVGKDRPGRCIL